MMQELFSVASTAALFMLVCFNSNSNCQCEPNARTHSASTGAEPNIVTANTQQSFCVSIEMFLSVNLGKDSIKNSSSFYY